MKAQLLKRPFASLVVAAMLLGLHDPEACSQSLEDQLLQLVQARLGSNFVITSLVEIDKAVNDVNRYLPLPEDPYGTLHNCVVFGGGSGSARTGSFVGVYRDGNIMWLSDTTLATPGPTFWTSREINQDGNVELLFQENNFPSSSQVWIFRWNGSIGTLLSRVSPNGLSVIRGASFTLFDAEADGTLEIADFGRVDGSAIWSWNGTQYGAWPTTPHLPATTIWPRNRVDAVVHCSAQNDTGNGRIYRYSITCKPTSIQRINEFTIWGIRAVRQVIRPEHWDGAFNSGRPKVWYSVKAVDERGVIKQDSTRGGFFVSADASPCTIVRYTLLGENELPAFAEDTLASLQRWLSAEENNNAVSGSTIASASAPVPFLATAFLDSLSDYATRARTLGWIIQDSTSAKYIGFFSTAKLQIQAGTLDSARATFSSVLHDVSIDSLSVLTTEACAIIRFNTEYLLSKFIPSPDVKGGLFAPPSHDVLTIKVKPDTSFTLGDSLTGLSATVRWPSQYNVTFGAVTSTFGFTKIDTPVTVGNYKYQRFRTTTHTPISWQAGQEYELFSDSLVGLCGLETFELTNALSGGDWFVDINYLDKTDTTFYQSSVQGFAYQNKSSETWATIPNDQRHLIKGAGKLHETYTSGGEILYRRSSNGGSAWDVTTRLSRGTASCYDATIAAGASNMLYSVWERNNGSTVGLWYSRSTDNGATWSLADTLPGCSALTPSSDQGGALRPVVAELSASPANHVIVVYADNGGLQYLKSTSAGASWGSGPTSIAPTLRTSTDNPKIWYPSIAPASSYLSLTYDYRALDPELYSRTYTASGGWSTESSVSSGTGTIYDRCSSVAILDDNTPLVAWCAQKMVGGTLDADYRIMFRTGTSSNTWNTFTEFAKTSGISDLYPTSSTLSGPYTIARGFRIIYQRTNGEVYTLAKPLTGNWSRARLSTSGAYVSATLEKGTNTGPTFLWTDQSASPYLIPVTTALGTPMAPLRNQADHQGVGTVLGGGTEEELLAHRKIIVEDNQNHSILSYELSPILLVNARGDTLALPFRSTDSIGALSLNTVWNYLGTEPIDIAKDARTVIMDVMIQSEASADTAGSGAGPLRLKENSFRSASQAYRLEVTGAAAGGKETALATDLGEGNSQAGTVKRTVVTIPAGLRGTRQAFRLVGAFVPPADLVARLILSVGDVIYAK
jgi:hypothetical protein